MNFKAMSKPRGSKPNGPKLALLALAALALPLAACGDAPAGPPPLEGAAMGGPFELVNGAGETVRWADFDGRYRIMYFGFTNCPDICPTDVQRTAQGLRQFAADDAEAAAKVQQIFVSVDPARDTPEKVAEFAAAFSDDLIGLTGSKEQIDAATSTFGAFYSLEEPNEDGAYNVQHSTNTILYGPAGEPIAPLPTDLGANAVAAELAKWVR